MSTTGSIRDDQKTNVGVPSPNLDSGLDEKKKTASIDSSQTTGKAAEPTALSPVSFFQLFRYSTRFEIVVSCIALLAAAGAGTAQPMMTLLFGRLAQEFVVFAALIAREDGGDAEATALIPAAAEAFRDAAAANATYLVYIGVAMFACTYTYMFVWTYHGEVTTKRLREKYLQAVLRQEIAYFDNVGAGEVATRISTDTHLVQQATSEKVALTVNYMAAFFSGFILAYVRSWRLALALTSMLPCILVAGGVSNFFCTKYKQLALDHAAEGGNVAEEVISTVRTAQAFGTQKILARIHDGFVKKALVLDLKSSMWYGSSFACIFFIIYSAYGLAFHFGTTLINNGQADAGTVVNVFLAVFFGCFGLTMMAGEMQALTLGCSAAAKLYEAIDRVPEIDSSDDKGLQPGSVTGEITLMNVNFSYPSRPTVQVTRDLSLTFLPGTTSALVGASGSGKSTIISLIERFYDPTSGRVLLDGVELTDLNVKWLRSQIGLVSQEPVLFATTIKDNVAYGLINTKYENAPEEERFALVKEACIKANADGFITKLSSGYDTMVGERGFLLSGGQRQRIAIARAIVSDPRILLLDEATSALDTQAEGIVQDALNKASAGRTTITIAHRLSTTKTADIIYVLGDGRVLEQGTHHELLDAGGAYFRLVAAQKVREAKDAESIDGATDDPPTHVDVKAAAHEEHSKDGHGLAPEIMTQRPAYKKDGANRANLPLFTVIKRMAILVPDLWKTYIWGVVFACMSGMVYPVFGIVYANGMDGFSQPDPAERRLRGDRTALYFFIVSILAGIAMGMQNHLFMAAVANLTARLRSLSFKAILRQDVEFFDRDENSTGSLTSNLSENPQKVNGLAGVTLGTIVQALASIIGGSAIGLAFIWKLALVAVACMPLLMGAGYVHLRVVVMKDQVNKKAHAESAQLACEAAGSIRTVASLTREHECLELYSQALEKPLRKSKTTAAWSTAMYALSTALSFFVIALVFWYGSRLVANREASTFQFFIGLMSTTFAAIEVGNLFALAPNISHAQAAGSDIIRLLDSVPQVDAESGEGRKVASETIEGHIKLEDVHFRYPTRPGVRVLRGLDIDVQPGTYVALVGASGSGKSTVIQLLERFYDPVSGNIYFDGEKISELNVQDYRKHIALVSQEPTLYAGTIRFNILLGAIRDESEITQEEIETACRNANILDFINSLPDGFDTEVGRKGSQLSGGQKQRIAIARALLRNPKVLLLDEATSALDSNSEKVVQAALDEAVKGRTTVAIAHRLSTIQNADKIYFLKDGCVSEVGTHDQLVAARGDYFDYVQLQALRPEA